MNERSNSEKLQKLKIQLEEKEFAYRMNKILFRQTPFYYLSWIVSVASVTILILFIYAVENALSNYIMEKDKLLIEIIFTLFMILIYGFIIAQFVVDASENEYFNLKRMNKALKKIKQNLLTKNIIWLTLPDDKKNDFYIYDSDANPNPTTSNLLKSIINNPNKPLTYRDVYQQNENIKKQITDIKAKIKIEKMLLMQKEFLD